MLSFILAFLRFLLVWSLQITSEKPPLTLQSPCAPIDGIIRYRQYHSGRYLVAFHSKASDQNERSTLVIETSGGELILVRQIAGAVARRISTYPNVGNLVLRGDEIGFIKFGSRVDVFLPLNASLLVKVGDKVRVGLTPLATLDAQNI